MCEWDSTPETLGELNISNTNNSDTQGSLVRQPCAALGILHACGFPKAPKYTLWIKLAVSLSKALPFSPKPTQAQVPSVEPKASQSPAPESFKIFCGSIKHVQRPTAAEGCLFSESAL